MVQCRGVPSTQLAGGQHLTGVNTLQVIADDTGLSDAEGDAFDQISSQGQRG